MHETTQAQNDQAIPCGPRRTGTLAVGWSNRAAWLGKPGPFAKLHELKTRDQIIVHAFGEKYIFEVLTNAIVAPNDRSVMRHEESPWITLVTCTDYDQKTGTYKNRFIVRAVLVKVSADKIKFAN